MKAAAAEKGLATIFTVAASSEEAVEWLLFAVPPFAEQDNADVGEEGGSDAGDTEEKEKGTPYEHKLSLIHIWELGGADAGFFLRRMFNGSCR